MAWCAGQKYTTDAVSGDEQNAEFFRVLRGQILGEAVSPTPTLQEGGDQKPPKPGTSLEFMFLDLNKQSMQLLLQALYYHRAVHEIKRIVFHGCRIRDQVSLELLAHVFHMYTHWEEVEISCLCQGLGNEQARILIMEIMKSKDLKHLNISSMAISDGLIFWRDLLSSPHSARPTSIAMRSSRIDFDYTQDFLSIIQPPTEQRHSLKHLDLSACRMDDRAMDMVATGLKTMKIVLESLALKGNRLSPKSIPVIAQLINDHESLKALDLSMNTRLFSADDKNAEKNIEKVIRAAIPEDSSGSLERLVLSKTSVGEKAAIMMIKSLERNTVLQELDLNFCLLGERVMAQVVMSLPKMRSLRKLLLHGLHFNQRNAANQPHEQRQTLWNALQVNTSLVKIQGLNMFLGAGRPELASEIQDHLSARNQALHYARSMNEDGQGKIGRAKKTLKKKSGQALWPYCLEKLGRGGWTASAVYLFLQNNANAIPIIS